MDLKYLFTEEKSMCELDIFRLLNDLHESLQGHGWTILRLSENNVLRNEN